MTTADQKHQILESLNELDSVQAQKVLSYIKDLLCKPQDDATYEKFKRQALREIRQALGKNRKLKPAL